MKALSPLRSAATSIGSALLCFQSASFVLASEYGGTGFRDGLNASANVVGNANIRSTTETIVRNVLSYMALAAVVVIVIAGMFLIFGMGSDESKDRAKKIVLFTVIGLVLILIARGIVEIFTDAANNVATP